MIRTILLATTALTFSAPAFAQSAPPCSVSGSTVTIAVPVGSVTSPAQTITVPASSVTAPAQTVTVPTTATTVTLGAGVTLSVPSAPTTVTAPAQTVAVPAGTVTAPAQTVAVPAASVSCTLPATTSGGGTTTPPTTTGALPGLSVENTGTAASSPTYLTYQQAFAQGALPSGSGLSISFGSSSGPVQVDVKTTWPDGSARLAILTFQAPSIAAGATAAATLAASAAATGTAVSLSSSQLTGTLTLHNGTTTTPYAFSAAALLKQTPAYWLQGPLVTEARYVMPVAGSTWLQFDLRAYADGTRQTVIGVRNDVAMGATGGQITYDLGATDGVQSVTATALTQYQYENAPFEMGTVPVLNLRRDIASYISAGALLPYNITGGYTPVYATTANATQQAFPSASDTGPLQSCGITTYMPMTGGRPDIGPTTAVNADWLYDQSALNAQWAHCQAVAGWGIPWNFWDTAHGHYLSVLDYPTLQTTWNPNGQQLTQGVSTTNNGWTPDVAHQPDVFFVPYLLTGTHWMLDGLQAQAAASVLAVWTGMRNNAIGASPQTNDNVIFGNQLRGGAWSMREIGEAAFASPSSPDQSYLAGVNAHNWAWMAGQIPSLTTIEGQAAGYVIDTYEYGPCIAPWQEGFFSIIAQEAALFGDANALAVVKWMSGFWDGAVANLGPTGAATYALTTFSSSTGSNGQIYWPSGGSMWTYTTALQTWSAIAAASQPYALNAQNAVYGALTLAERFQPSTANAAALSTFEAAKLPYANSGAMQTAPNFWFAP